MGISQFFTPEKVEEEGVLEKVGDDAVVVHIHLGMSGSFRTYKFPGKPHRSETEEPSSWMNVEIVYKLVCEFHSLHFETLEAFLAWVFYDIASSIMIIQVNVLMLCCFFCRASAKGSHAITTLQWGAWRWVTFKLISMRPWQHWALPVHHRSDDLLGLVIR